jgi:hypothetical protein
MTKKTELRRDIDSFCDENYPDDEILLFGGPEGDCYDGGFIGVGQRMNSVPIAIYDREICVDALANEFANDAHYDEDDTESDPHTDAEEFFSFNTEGAYMGEQTPLVITRFRSCDKL